jgi:thioesterase domain-containing protein
VAALADLVAKADSPSSTSPSMRRPARTLPTSLVQIKPGTERPLFLIHPVGGHVYFYHHLAACLDAAQPVFGLEAQGQSGRVTPPTGVEEMAARYLKAIRSVQPEGPFLLGGSSFGGLVAFEMAHQLLASRERVALLTMMDTPAPAEVAPQIVGSLDRLAYLISGDPSLPVSAAEIQHLSPDEQLLYVLRRKRGVQRMFPKLAIPELARFRETVTTNLQALLSYVARPCPVHILFFRAQERDAFTATDPSSGWLNLAEGGLTILDVPGNHITMSFPPNVQVVADHLREAIAAARAYG